jgi:RecJ-like exonuclease
MMISADNETQARTVWSQGGRTFRVVKNVSEVVKSSEIVCPASKEAGQVTTCAKCGLCGGSNVKAKSIAIVDHGPQRKRNAA